MIKISMAESFAFDILSIYQIKMERGDTEEKRHLSGADFFFLQKEMIEQLGKNTYEKIVGSEEYNRLFRANDETFNVVALAKTDEVRASDVDRSNFERYKAKIALQNKFFSTKLTEIKVGYEKIA